MDTFRNIDNEEEIDSLISDYVLDIKAENSEEFKSDQIPENSPNVLKMAEEKDNKDSSVNEINEDVPEDSSEDEDEDEVIDNSPDKEMVINAVNDITAVSYTHLTLPTN